MKYFRVDWMHDFPDEPVTYYLEIGEDLYELRKLVLYRDGRYGYAMDNVEFGGAVLSEVPMVSIEEIEADAQFRAAEISSRDFEAVWNKYLPAY